MAGEGTPQPGIRAYHVLFRRTEKPPSTSPLIPASAEPHVAVAGPSTEAFVDSVRCVGAVSDCARACAMGICWSACEGGSDVSHPRPRLGSCGEPAPPGGMHEVVTRLMGGDCVAACGAGGVWVEAVAVLR